MSRFNQIDHEMMRRAEDLRARSTDRSRKVGCVLTNAVGDILAEGWNAFPPGLLDLDERHQRPQKYDFTECAERWAVADAAQRGVALKGSTAYLPWFPCCACGRMLTLSGVERVVCREPDLTDPKFGAGFANLVQIFAERGVRVDYYPYPDPEPQVRTDDSVLRTQGGSGL